MTRLALAAALALAACVSPALSADPDGSWRLVALDGRTVYEGPFRATMAFGADGALSGEAFCNRWSARNEARFPKLKIGAITATERACDAMPEEAKFYEALGQMQTGTVDEDGILILSSAEGRLMEFHPASGFKTCKTCLHIRWSAPKQP